MEHEDGTVTLCLTFADETSPLFHLTLLASQLEQAQNWSQTFQENPSAIYLGIIQLLDRQKEEKHETK